MFENLKNRLSEYHQEETKETLFYIENGYFKHWNNNQQIFSDNGLKRYSTETRWNQYQAGTISREKAVLFAVKRYLKKASADYNKKLEKIDKIAAAADLFLINVNVIWKRSYTWGYNPTVFVSTNSQDTTGSASGCGYDKESAAIAEAFNRNDSILKTLYMIKEKALSEGKSDYSKTACTHVSNTETCGYGAGYTVLPYFEGGVGSSCFWSILGKAGFSVRCNRGKKEDFYTLYKA